MCGCNNLLHIGTFSCRPDSRGFFPDLGFHVNSYVVRLDFVLLLFIYLFFVIVFVRVLSGNASARIVKGLFTNKG